MTSSSLRLRKLYTLISGVDHKKSNRDRRRKAGVKLVSISTNWIFTATVKSVGKESELFNIELTFAPRAFHLQMKQKLRFSKR